MFLLGNIKTKVDWAEAGITLTLSTLHEDNEKAFYEAATESLRESGKLVDIKHDDVEFRKLVGQGCISSWEGVGDEQGKPVPCTPENIARFMRVPTARQFVMSKVRSLQLSVREEEADAKND